MSTPVELTLHGLSHGGEGVGRLPDGKACFVPDTIPGERVLVEVVEQRRRWARARLVEVLEASPDRVEPPCPYVGRCGGCKLQHVAPARQANMLARIVTEQLERIGKIPDPPVEATRTPHAPDGLGYRTHARFTADEHGRLGFRARASHEVVPIDRCLLLTDDAHLAREQAGDAWQGVAEIVARASATDGHRALEVYPGPEAMPPLPDTDIPVAVVGSDGAAVALRGEPGTVERVAGFDFRISPTSFFQASRAGAETLVGLVREEAAVATGETVLDLYAGVGLFSRALAADGGRVTAVEGNPAAADDARANLAGTDATVVAADVEEFIDGLDWSPQVVVLDPPRKGAGPALSARLAALEPRALVYVSCDPAALARDSRALIDAGMTLRRVVPVDHFSHTAHVEIVASFT